MGRLVRTEMVDGITGVAEMMQETWTNNEITTLLEGLNETKHEAWVTGELKNVRPPVTLPKFSWDKKDD